MTVGAQVTRKKMDCASPWILDKAITEEIESTWKGTYVKVPERSVPRSASIFSSHIDSKVKRDEKAHKLMKGRLCLHGNREEEKGNIRNDSASAQFRIIHLLLSLATLLMLRIWCIEIK